jgi:hypothetical protein
VFEVHPLAAGLGLTEEANPIRVYRRSTAR